jgi:hypothetical protein
MTTATAGRRVAPMNGAKGGRRRKRCKWCISTATYKLHQEASRGGLPKPHIPHQEKAQGQRHDEKLHDLRVPHLGADLDEGPNRSDTMSFHEENAVMMVYRGCPPPSGRHCVSSLSPNSLRLGTWGLRGVMAQVFHHPNKIPICLCVCIYIYIYI